MSRTAYVLFCGLCISVLKEVNHVVDEPYMVCLQSSQRCVLMGSSIRVPRTNLSMSPRRRHTVLATSIRGILSLLLHLDCELYIHLFAFACIQRAPRYILSLIIHRVFVMKCTLPILRVTSLLSLLAMPIAVTRLLCFYKRVRPPPLFAPDVQAIIISMFPIAWFFGFLYYTDVPSVVFVLATVASAGAHKHWLAATVSLCIGQPLPYHLIAKTLVWPTELHLSTDERHMGFVCVCFQSAHVLALQKGAKFPSTA